MCYSKYIVQIELGFFYKESGEWKFFMMSWTNIVFISRNVFENWPKFLGPQLGVLFYKARLKPNNFTLNFFSTVKSDQAKWPSLVIFMIHSNFDFGDFQIIIILHVDVLEKEYEMSFECTRVNKKMIWVYEYKLTVKLNSYVQTFLTHFMALVTLLSGGVERDQWHEVGWKR